MKNFSNDSRWIKRVSEKVFKDIEDAFKRDIENRKCP